MIELDLASYDYIIVAISGGKDSVACTLQVREWMQECGAKGQLIGWHHSVDGAPHGPDGKGIYGISPDESLMDWPCTEDYTRKLFQYLGIPLELSWLEGGFKREMLRDNTPKARTFFETPEGIRTAGGKGPPGTRQVFPQVTANLSQRWCSPYLKIDVCDVALGNQSERFNESRTLVITGERREESAARARYAAFESHRKHAPTSKLKRHIDHYRLVIDWDEVQIWDIYKRHGIIPHPCYRLGFSRCSCMTCIFSSNDQLATLWEIAQDYVRMQAEYEKQFGKTVHRTRSVMERVFLGTPYEVLKQPDIAEVIRLAMGRNYDGPIWVPSHEWQLPAGAFGEDKAGPT